MKANHHDGGWKSGSGATRMQADTAGRGAGTMAGVGAIRAAAARLGGVSGTLGGLCVAAFALSMLGGSLWVSYGSSLALAWCFVPLACALAVCAPPAYRAFGLAGLAFAAMYALCNSLVYFTQLTVVRQGGLPSEILSLLDFQQFGLAFHWDLLGYAMMAAATFFLSWTVAGQGGAARWLRGLLRLHGVFVLPCLLLPALGVFRAGDAGAAWMGTLALEAWCAYFLPVELLAAAYFWKDGAGHAR